MKFLLLGFFLGFSFLSISGQSNNTLRGKMLYLSSGKKPAVGVKLSGKIKNLESANIVYTTDDGSYVLVFPHERDGNLVILDIGKDDQGGNLLEVVNTKEIEVCRIPADPLEEFEIIVCKKGSRDLVAQKYYNIIKASSDEAISIIKQEMDELLTLKEKDYKKITSLSQRIIQMEEQADSLKIYREAFQIASINKDNASSRILKYLTLLDEGNSIQESREALDLKSASSELSMGMNNFNNALKELKTRANASLSIFDFNDAITCYDTIITYSEKMGLDPLTLSDQYNKTADIHVDAGLYQKALDYQQKSISILESISQLEPILFANSYNDLGKTHFKLNQFQQAMDIHNKALDILNGDVGKYPGELAQTYNHIGNAFIGLGNYDQALDYHMLAFKVHEEYPDLKDQYLSETYVNLGTTYLFIGRFSEARAMLEKAISVQEKIMSKQDPKLAVSYNYLGFSLASMGSYESALTFQLKAIGIQENSLGLNHPELATTYTVVGSTFDKLQDFDQSIEYLLKAMSINEKVLSPESLELATAYNNISMSYQHNREHDIAYEYQKKAIKIQEKRLGKKHPELSISYNNLGLIYQSLGDYESTLKYQKKGINILEGAPETNISSLGNSYFNIGSTYDLLDRPAKALDYYLKAGKMMESNKDLDRNSLAWLFNAMANLYAYSKIYDQGKALFYFNKSIDIYKESDHPNKENVSANLYRFKAGNAFMLKNYEEALKEHLAIVEIDEKRADWTNIGLCYYYSSMYPEAIEAYIKSAAFTPEIKSSYFYNNIGMAYAKNGKFEDAFHAFAKNEELFPKEGRTFRNWALYYALQGEKEKAIESLEKAVDLGFKDKDWLETDESMDPLRDDPSFHVIFQKMQHVNFFRKNLIWISSICVITIVALIYAFRMKVARD
ncbi:MAG: tetratricopeptide repeat protein [Saprospiraceae bacterium]|nr:tetratricopeptide repeat protein [Saprospiraceae bacterium]